MGTPNTRCSCTGFAGACSIAWTGSACACSTTSVGSGTISPIVVTCPAVTLFVAYFLNIAWFPRYVSVQRLVLLIPRLRKARVEF